MQRNTISSIAAVAALVLLHSAGTCCGAILSWDPVNDLPNGVLGLTSLTVNGPEVRFTNPGNEGFDVGFQLTSPNLTLVNPSQYFGSSDEPLLPNPPLPAGGNYIYIVAVNGADNTIFMETRFYATGTNNPVDVKGLKLQLEDVERGDTTRECVDYSRRSDCTGPRGNYPAQEIVAPFDLKHRQENPHYH